MWCSNINERCALRDEGGMKYLCGVCMGFVLYIQCTPDTSTQFIVLHLLLFVFIDSCLGGYLQGFFLLVRVMAAG